MQDNLSLELDDQRNLICQGVTTYSYKCVVCPNIRKHDYSCLLIPSTESAWNMKSKTIIASIYSLKLAQLSITYKIDIIQIVS